MKSRYLRWLRQQYYCTTEQTVPWLYRLIINQWSWVNYTQCIHQSRDVYSTAMKTNRKNNKKQVFVLFAV